MNFTASDFGEVRSIVQANNFREVLREYWSIPEEHHEQFLAYVSQGQMSTFAEAMADPLAEFYLHHYWRGTGGRPHTMTLALMSSPVMDAWLALLPLHLREGDVGTRLIYENMLWFCPYWRDLYDDLIARGRKVKPYHVWLFCTDFAIPGLCHDCRVALTRRMFRYDSDESMIKSYWKHVSPKGRLGEMNFRLMLNQKVLPCYEHPARDPCAVVRGLKKVEERRCACEP